MTGTSCYYGVPYSIALTVDLEREMLEEYINIITVNPILSQQKLAASLTIEIQARCRSEEETILSLSTFAMSGLSLALIERTESGGD